MPEEEVQDFIRIFSDGEAGVVSGRGFAASVGGRGARAASQALAGWCYRCRTSLAGQHLAPETGKGGSGPVNHKHLLQWHCRA